MHLDAQRYAKLRGIGEEEAIAELTEFMAELLPNTPITVED